MRAKLPYLSAEPICMKGARIQHSWRGINWPGTASEEHRRNDVTRCMQRCRTCGHYRVTRYIEPTKPGKDAIGSWDVEGFLPQSLTPGRAGAS